LKHTFPRFHSEVWKQKIESNEQELRGNTQTALNLVVRSSWIDPEFATDMVAKGITKKCDRKYES